MTTSQAADAPILPNQSQVRYEGSIEEFRGRLGEVKRAYPYRGEIRYDVALTGSGAVPAEDLALVRRQSLVVLDDQTRPS